MPAPAFRGWRRLCPAFYSGLAARGDKAPEKAAGYLAERPAKFFGLWPKKGSLTVGADADLMILEERSFVYDARNAHDDLNWSPFDGTTFSVRIAATFLRGRPVYDGSAIVGKPGFGRFLPRQAAG